MKNYVKNVRRIIPTADRKKAAGRGTFWDSVVVKWNLWYAVFIFVMLLSFTLFASHCLNIIEQDITDSNTVVLETLRLRMDTYFDGIKSLADTLALDSNMQNVVAEDRYEDVSRYDLYLLGRNYSRYALLHNTGDELMIYYPYLDLAMSGTHYGNAQKIWDLGLKKTGFTYEDWKTVISQECAGTQIFTLQTTEGKNSLVLVRTVHTLAHYSHYANLVAVIDEEALFTSVLEQNNGTVFLYNRDKNIAVSTQRGNWPELFDLAGEMKGTEGSFTATVGGESTVVSYTHSKNTEWVYGVATARATYLGTLIRLSGFLTAVCVAYLLLGGFLICFSAWRNYRWIHSITQLVNGPQPGAYTDAEYRRLTQSIEGLRIKNRTMQDTEARQREAIRRNMLQRLIDLDDPRRLPPRTLLESYGIQFQDGYFAVAAFALDRPRSYLLDLICACVGKKAAEHSLTVYFWQESTTALFILNGAMDYEQFTKQLRAALSGARAEIDHGAAVPPYRMAVSDITDTWQHLNRAYNSVMRVFEYKDETGTGVEFFGDLNAIPSEAVLRYTPEADAKLFSSVSAGDAPAACAFIERIIAANEKNLLNEEALLFLTGNLLSTVYRASESVLKDSWEPPSEETLTRIYAEKSPQKLCLLLRALTEDMCAGIVNYRQQYRALKSRSTFLDAESYVMKNYSDVNLSVNSIAERFDLNVSSLSKLFKEEGSDNLSTFISHVRTDEAKKRLLRGEELEKIGVACGFGSQRTFLRVFKQMVGMTPTQYKNSVRERAEQPEPDQPKEEP